VLGTSGVPGSGPVELASEPVTVRVPATSANLGPGFDTLGLALSLYDEVTVEVLDASPGPPEITVEGQGADEVATDEGHLVHRSLCAGFQAMALTPPRVRLQCRNDVPHGRGLGSSSAAIVSGLWAARELVADGSERWSDAAMLDLAARIEGHPDNVAPAMLGGFTIAYQHDGEYAATSLRVQPGLSFLVLVPEQPVATSVARTLLPLTVTHEDAARTGSRTALLTAVLTGAADAELALVATEDWLHQPYRGDAMGESVELMQELRHHGVPAVISGAGPAVLVLGWDAALGELPAAHRDGWTALALQVDTEGATRLSPV
jgi:homoserine kinase